MSSTDAALEDSAEAPAGASFDVQVAASAVAAFGAFFSGVEPTGTPWWDPILAAGLAVVFVLAAARSSRWVLLAAAAVATLFVGFSPWLAVAVGGCAALAASMVIPHRSRDLRTISGALIFLGLLHLGNFGFFGLSALLASGALCPVLFVAYQSLAAPARATVRRSARWGAIVIGALLAFGAAQALSVREVANEGADAARAGIAAARSGDTQELSQQLEKAEAQLGEANDKVTSPLLRPLALVPVVAQHLRSVQTTTEQASAVASEARSVAVDANIEELTMRQGQFDLALLAEMAPRLERAATSLQTAVREINNDRSPWLLPVVDRQVQLLLDEVEAVIPEAQVAAQAARVMPQMLGNDGERRYLMLFGSPAEAREFGGFVAGYALIGVDAGDLNLIQAGSVNDIVPIANLEKLDDPQSYPVEYVKADPALFPQNLTSTPNIELLALAVRDVFPELFGAPIDGVIYLDPFALASITEITGPLSVEGIGEDLVGDDITDFIFDGQYRIFADRAERFEAIAELAQVAATGFATIDLPGPEELGRVLGPVARAGRLQVITYDDAENEFLAAVKLQRYFQAPQTIDAFAVIHTNGTASKLDLYLHRKITYDVTIADGSLQAIVDVELRSIIPPGVPELTYGFTDGTNEVLLSLYSPHDLTGLTVDGQPHEFVAQPEFGFSRYALFKIPIAPNSGADVRFFLSGDAPADPYRVGVWAQPGVNNDVVEIVYRTQGNPPISAVRELREGWLFEPNAVADSGG